MRLIDADALIEDVRTWVAIDGREEHLKADVIEWLKEFPSVQLETAKRIVGKSRDGMTLWYQCDTCNEPVDAQDNYCRGCGRRLIDG